MDRIRTLSQRAILVRMPAFGLDGPFRDRTGFAMVIERVIAYSSYGELLVAEGVPAHAVAHLLPYRESQIARVVGSMLRSPLGRTDVVGRTDA